MKIRMIILLFAVAASVYGGEVEEVLKTLPAPPQEYVRIPAKYVFQRLEKTARRSGDPALAGFSIEVRKAGADEQRVSINLENMTLLQALQAAATATGTELRFEGGRAVLAENRSAPPAAVAPEPVDSAAASADDDGGKVSFADVNKALVFIETGVGRGSAFIAEMDGTWYIISNQHNFVNAKKLELRAMHGGLLEFSGFEYNRNRDLVRLELPPEQRAGLTALRIEQQSPGIGDAVAIYGNSAGGNVATELKGKVLGVGPRDIEVDASIVPGNSGSPILNDAGHVLGVATYLSFALNFEGNEKQKQIFKGTRFGKTRRYGVRIPNDGWVQAEMRPFLQQTYQLNDAKNYLELLHILAGFWSGDDDYRDAAYVIMTSYSSSGNRVKPPYEFHEAKTEEEIRMFVKAFKRNFEEFEEIVQEMEISKKELAQFGNTKSRKSSGRIDRVDYHLRTMLLGKARQLQDNLKRYSWMSRFLKGEADPLDEMAGNLIRQLEAMEDMRGRIKAVM